MDKHFQVGDKVMVDMDYYMIVCGGRISGLNIKQEDTEKIAIITHIHPSNGEKYPIELNTSIGGVNKFSSNELRKL